MHAVPRRHRESGCLMSEGRWDTERLRELAQAMADASICGLGQAAANPVLRVLEHFPEDVTH